MKEAELRCVERCLQFAAFLDWADATLMPGIFRTLEVDFGASPKTLSTIVLLSAGVASICNPVWGALSDRAQSRKRILVWGCASWGVLTLAMAASQSLIALTVARMINGVALAALAPLSQSILADITPPSGRGRAYGRLAFVGSIGGILGGGMSTTFSAGTCLGVRTWRLVFAGFGSACIAAAPILQAVMVEPVRGLYDHDSASSGGGESKEYSSCEAVRTVFSNKTFLLIISQGAFGTIPWVASGSFFPLFFSYCNFTSGQVASLTSVTRVGSVFGTLWSGWFGDAMARWSPDHGRVFVAQLTVMLGIPIIFAILVWIPREAESFHLFLAALTFFYFVACWTPAATNRPVQTEIVDPSIRGTILAWDICMEGAFSAFGGYAVGFLSQDVFGYKMSTKPVTEMSNGDRLSNASALSQALFWTMLLPWAACFCFYSLMHYTYKRDKQRHREEVAKRRSKSAEDATQPGAKAPGYQKVPQIIGAGSTDARTSEAI